MEEYNQQLEEAFLALQKELPPIEKCDKVSFGNTTYFFAPLDYIQGKVYPLAHRHGFSIRQGIQYHEGVNCIMTRLSHSKSKGAIQDSFALPVIAWDAHTVKDSKNVGGSHITFFKRYALCSTLGLILVGEDTDGEDAKNVTRKNYKFDDTPAPHGSISDVQWKTIYPLIKGNYALINALKSSYNIEDLKHLPASEYDNVMTVIAQSSK